MNQRAEAAAQPLTEQIRAAVESGDLSLPPFPAVVTELMELLRDEAGASSKRVARLVRNDPAVVATLLKWANSPVFGGLHPISDLSQAIARLGFRQVTSAVTALAHSNHFKSDDAELRSMLEVLWSHAVAASLAARRVAKISATDLEEAFVAGLLHDAGKLIVLKGIEKISSRDDQFSITSTVLDELLELLHPEIGYKTLTAWHLPEQICQVALLHHDEEADTDNPLVTCVQVADPITRKMGEHPKPDPDLDLLELPAIERLNLGDIEIATLMVDIEEEVAEVKKLIQPGS